MRSNSKSESIPLNTVKWLANALAWILDFFAEDIVLIGGMVVAILATALAVHVVPRVSGYVLWALIALTVTVSLARTVSALRR